MAETIKTPKANEVLTFNQALLAVQKELPALQKNAINPHFKSKYISLDNLMEQILPVLHKHDFIWMTLPTTLHNGDPALSYVLRYIHGGQEAGTMPLMLKVSDPQGQGSAITYARRYSLMAVLGLVADEDDDGEKAQEAAAAPAKDLEKANIVTMLTKLGKDEAWLETQVGESLDSMSQAKAREVVEQLKLAVQRQNLAAK